MRNHEVHRPWNEELFYQNRHDILSPEIANTDIKDKIPVTRQSFANNHPHEIKIE